MAITNRDLPSAFASSVAFAWGRGGHQIIVIAAEHCTRPETAARVRELLALLFLDRKVQSEIPRCVENAFHGFRVPLAA
jgi:hypothetical protein